MGLFVSQILSVLEVMIALDHSHCNIVNLVIFTHSQIFSTFTNEYVLHCRWVLDGITCVSQ